MNGKELTITDSNGVAGQKLAVGDVIFIGNKPKKILEIPSNCTLTLEDLPWYKEGLYRIRDFMNKYISRIKNFFN